MLKQYTRLLYTVGMVIFINLLCYPVFSQTGQPEDKVICKENPIPVDLFKVLGMQVSPSNGYWTDAKGKPVSNIFNPIDSASGKYSFSFNITTEQYCGTFVGQKFDVKVNIVDQVRLEAFPVALDAACNLDNGRITIGDVQFGSNKYSYTLLQKGASRNDTLVKWTAMPKDLSLEPVVIDKLTQGEYYLFVRDESADVHIQQNHACYTPLWGDTITLGMSANSLNVDIEEIIGTGHYQATANNGTGNITYEWYEDQSHIGDPTKVVGKGQIMIPSFGTNYWVVATDERGCSAEKERKNTIGPDDLQLYYYFCQGDFTEMLSGKELVTRTIDSLIFSTAKVPGKFEGFTVKVYTNNSAGALPAADKDAWLIDAIENGTTADTIVRYLDLIKPDGTIAQSKMKVKVKIFNSPTDLGLRLLNNKFEWQLDDKVDFEAMPENKDGYLYFLNNKLLNLNGPIDENLYSVEASRFTGTVQDMMKVHVIDSITMLYVNSKSKSDACIWIAEEPVIVNVPFPNTFTPDGDGINDVFLGGDKFGNREFTLEIINRYGARLYMGSKGWDGTYKGSEMPSGAYLYIVHLKMADGTTKTMTGSVALIRKQR